MDQSLKDKAVLKVEGLHLSFGGVKALSDVSFVVKKGESTGLLDRMEQARPAP